MSGKHPINLRRLSSDLASLAPSRANFEALCKEKGLHLSEDTIGRIKSEGKATLKSLQIIAKVLGTHEADYLINDKDIRRSFNLSGEWIAVYQETWPPKYNVSRTRERLVITHSGIWIRGTYEFLSNDDPTVKRSTVFEMHGRLVGDFVTGFYFVRGREAEQGIGTFQLKLLDQATFAEGFCTYCSDDDVVAVSPNMWIKLREHDSSKWDEFAMTALSDPNQFAVRPRAR